MSSNIYHYIYSPVYCPTKRGLRLEFQQLPSWVHLEVVTEDGSKVLIVHSRIHVNKRTVCNPSFSTDFSDHEIVKYFSERINKWFL